jgi:heme/copper-type cytochrome/quinol oxidase subunit 3
MTTPQDVETNDALTTVHGSEIDEAVELVAEDIAVTTGTKNAKISNAKLAIWLFLASDFLFFGGFISAYLLYRGRSLEIADAALAEGVEPGKILSDVLDIPFTSATSFILLMSSLTMVLALAAIKRNDMRRTQLWLIATALFGTIFLGGQIFEFTEFVREGFTLTTNLSGTTFFVLTGLHGAHVTVGIFWLMSLMGLSMSGKLTSKDSEKVEIAGLYWHFVDVIWIVIFTLIYLIPVN